MSGFESISAFFGLLSWASAVGLFLLACRVYLPLARGLLERRSRGGSLSSVDKKRLIVIVVALAFPFAACLIDVFHGIKVAGLSLAPPSCLISALLMVFGIGRVSPTTSHRPQAHELVVEQLEDPVMVLGSSETVDWINQSAKTLFAETSWRPGIPLSRFCPQVHALLQAIRDADETTFEKDSRQYQIKSTPLLNQESGPAALVLMFRDVTQLKAKERLEAEVLELQETQGELVRLVQEKEVLIQEVHHRVKNNLQTVISLINLQSRRLPDDSAMRGLLNDMRTRVRTISLVHEQIYRSGFTSGMDLRDYLKDLVAEIASLYTVPGCSVSVRPTDQPVFVTMDFMLDFGLVINELVTNAFKHGILVRGSGEIVIALNPEHGMLRFSVTDTGPGFPQRGDGERTSTLGLSVVRAILKKYKAELSIEQNGGTKILISVPWEES